MQRHRDTIYKTMKKILKALFISTASLTLLVPSIGHASFECNASVLRVLIYNGGAVNVLHTGRGDYTVLCNLDSTYGGVTPTTCAMWTAMLQSIKKKNGLATFYFPGEGSCATMATYGNAPVPAYVGDATP